MSAWRRTEYLTSGGKKTNGFFRLLWLIAMLISSNDALHAQTLTWATGPHGGSWYVINEALAKLGSGDDANLHIEVIPGGGKDNPVWVDQGKASFGTSIDFLSVAARRGAPPYDAPALHLQTIGTGWSPLPFHVVEANGGAVPFKDALLGAHLRIAIPPVGTSDELTFQRIMTFYGTSYDKIAAAGGEVFHGDYDAIVAAFNDGKIDFVFGASSAPAPAITKIGAGSRHAVLIPMAADVQAYLHTQYGYGMGQIPAATYPGMQTGAVSTTVMETIFLVSADVPDSTVYEVTHNLLTHYRSFASIHSSMASFDPYKAWKNPPLPLHAGAARAYQELGFMPR